MKHFAAALALVLTLAVPRTAPAGENWDMVKEAWKEEPLEVIFAIPAFIVTAPFMLVKGLLDRIGEDDDEDEDY
jgi:hypothetical protein